MQKILFIDHHAELGGGEIALLEVIKNLDKQKFYPLVLLGNEGPLSEILKKEDIEVIVDRLPSYFRKLERSPQARPNIVWYIKSAISLPKVIKRTEDIIKKHNIDIVYINTIKSLLYAAKAAKRINVKAIWHLHDCLTGDFYPSWVIPIIVKLSRLADNIICVSNAVKDAYVKAKGDDKKTAVIYNGVDINKFNPQINADEIKKEFNTIDRKIVSITGRLEEWKGQKVFIKAAEITCSRRDDVVFLIVGGPLFGCEKYEQELKDMVKNLRLEDKVLFLGFRNDPEKIMAASDIIVHPSTKPEPFGRDIIEAMACGRPVIATSIGAGHEIIEDQKTGILVESANPGLLAKSIAGLLDNPRQIQILKSNAREKAVNVFDIRKIITKISDAIDRGI